MICANACHDPWPQLRQEVHGLCWWLELRPGKPNHRSFRPMQATIPGRSRSQEHKPCTIWCSFSQENGDTNPVSNKIPMFAKKIVDSPQDDRICLLWQIFHISQRVHPISLTLPAPIIQYAFYWKLAPSQGNSAKKVNKKYFLVVEQFRPIWKRDILFTISQEYFLPLSVSKRFLSHEKGHLVLEVIVTKWIQHTKSTSCYTI